MGGNVTDTMMKRILSVFVQLVLLSATQCDHTNWFLFEKQIFLGQKTHFLTVKFTKKRFGAVACLGKKSP